MNKLLDALALTLFTIWLPGTFSAAAECTPLPPNARAWWTAEGDANDQIGGNNGFLVGGATFVPGKVGQGFNFDGTSGYVQIPNSPSFDVGGQITIEFWMKAAPDNPMSTCCQGLVTSDFYGIDVGGGGPESVGVQLYASTTSGASWATTGDANGGGASVSSGVWHHIAGTFDGSQMQLYVDGQARGSPQSLSGSLSPMLDGSFISIGSESGRTTCPNCVGTRYFKGSLDEVTIFNRALSAQEIASIYQAGAAGKCTDTAPNLLSGPGDQSATAGSTATFAVFARGVLPLSYQWQFNGTNLDGATSNSLTLTNVQLEDVGTYSVTITNDLGSTGGNGVLTIAVPPPCYPTPAGLVGWWRGEGNALDQSGANSGSLQGGATNAPGKVGQALSFNGISSYVKIPKSKSLDVGAQFTVDFWMKADVTNSMGSCCQGLVTSDFYEVLVGGGGGERVGIQASVSATGGNSWASTGDANGGGVVLTPGEWHHIASTYNGAQLLLYVDGVPVGNPMPVSGAISPMLPNSFVAIGSESGRTVCPSCANSRFFSGLIDEVDIFNRALSADEIAGIFNASVSGKCLFTNPVSIATQPVSATVKPGTNVVFQVGAAGTAPEYQWLLNGTNITGATDSSLTFTNVQPSNAGTYSVVVTNVLNSVTSSNALLKVNVVLAFGNGALLTNVQKNFGGPVTVQLQNLYTNGLVFYTLDGTTPTFASTQYTGPFVVSHTAILRALGYSVDFQQFGMTDPTTIAIVPSFPLTVITNGGGTVALSPTNATYLSNSVATATATAAAGWTFFQWLGDASGTNPVTTVTMGGNRSIQAVFGTTLGTTAAGNGSVSLNPPGGVYPYGTVVEVIATPQSGNFFAIWGNAASGSANPLNFTLTNANQTVSALFQPLSGGLVALAVVPSGRGKVAISPAANAYAFGAGVTITATPDARQTFLGWSGDATGTSNPLNVTMNQSRVITANFTHKAVLTPLTPPSGLPGNGFEFAMDGDFSGVYSLESSTSLVNWLPLATLTNSFGRLQFMDMQATNAPRLFYRAVQIQ